MGIRNKFIWMLGGTTVAILILAAVVAARVRGMSGDVQAMRMTENVRLLVLSQSEDVTRLMAARERRDATTADELGMILLDKNELIQNSIEALRHGDETRGVPSLDEERLLVYYRFVMDLWPLYYDAVRGVVNKYAETRNAEFVRNNTAELTNRLGDMIGYRVQAYEDKSESIRLYLLVAACALVALLTGTGVVLFGDVLLPLKRTVDYLSSISGSPRGLDVAMPPKTGGELGEMSRHLSLLIENLREADQLKDQFLANMSHEIRTPLNGIVGFLENLAETELNEQQLQYVRVIQSSSSALLRVINDVLDFSKIQARRMELEAVAFDLVEVIQDVVAVSQQAAKHKRLDVRLSCPADEYSVIRGDPVRLRQVLANLLSNAIKFTETGEVKLSVDFAASAEDTRKITFAVSDTGVGMTQDQVSKLFQPFTQADASMSRKHGGTGLGLCIASNLVGLMGGELVVESQSGTGTRFSFTISVPIAPREEQVRLSDRHNIHFPPGAFKNCLIMVVDDNPTNLFLMETICQGIGLPYVTASNGEDAVENARQHRFDLIFMDIQMPVMDGYTAIREIRRIEKAATTQIIALTASAMQDDVEQALGAGSTGFLAKPFERNQLLLCIAEHLGIHFEREARPVAENDETPAEAVVREMYDFMRQQYQISLGEIKMILAQSVANWRPELSDILVFARKDNWPAVRRIMHTLKGQLASIGLPELAEASGSVTQRIKAERVDDLLPVLQVFVDELSGIFRVLEQGTGVDAQGRPVP